MSCIRPGERRAWRGDQRPWNRRIRREWGAGEEEGAGRGKGRRRQGFGREGRGAQGSALRDRLRNLQPDGCRLQQARKKRRRKEERCRGPHEQCQRVQWGGGGLERRRRRMKKKKKKKKRRRRGRPP